ncbi:MAG: alpha/beta fold hydrolase [Pseudomonadota bacterium]|nr:alpha/beta fold hydrolase [Pseudomonadota bacterium]
MLRSETAASPGRQAAALAGVRAYQAAPREARAPSKPVLHELEGARLIDHGGPSDARALIVIPSLINPPDILDLSPGQSLMGWLKDQGFRPFLLDWGTPGPDDRDRDVTAYVERILLPLIARFDRPPILVGYCLGGTLALAAACAAPVAGLALIATPWQFGGFGAAARRDIADLWRAAQPTCEALGLVPMEVLQAGFWKLDPAKAIAKYEAFSRMTPDSDAARAFVRLEDWANAGAPLTYAAGRQLFEDFVGNDLTGAGRWIVSGRAVDPERLTYPAIDVVSRNDSIVPAASAADLPDRRDLAAGHVGMIVGRGARAQLWEPLADWLSGIDGAR